MWFGDDTSKAYTPVPSGAERCLDDDVETVPSGAPSSGPPSPTLSSTALDEDRPSFAYLVSINSFAFSYSLTAATLGVVILPSESVMLFPESHAVMLGAMLGCTGVTQLIGPAVGYQSDRSTSTYGRRRPVLVLGTVLACIGCAAMHASRQHRLSGMFIVSLTLAATGLNASYASYTALLPDLVPLAHMGRASGIMAAMSMLGSLCGFTLFGFVLGAVHAYWVYCAALLLSTVVTCLTATEKALTDSLPFSFEELVAAYAIDRVEHADFFWVFVTRTFYYMCISLQAFGLFMLRDVQHVDDPTYFTSILAMTGQLCAAIVAVPSGRLSDRYGRKPLVFTSCFMMALVYLGFALSPSITVVLLLGIGFGVGNGMFLSVDYALACDVLPSYQTAAQGLGLWGVSAFLGSTIGPLIAGPLLAFFGSTPSPERYSPDGYLALNLAGAVYVSFAAFFLRYVSAR